MKAILAIVSLLLGICCPALAQTVDTNFRGPANSTILIVRHAEKPPSKAEGPGLTPAGEARARSYADYFRDFRIDGAPLRIDTLIATIDTAGSARPRLTLEPFSRASGLTLQQPFENDDVKGLAHWLADGPANRAILIAWHHERIPKLLAALGADPGTLIPGGEWPGQTYDWVMVLRYDADGRLSSSRRIVEPAFAGH